MLTKERALTLGMEHWNCLAETGSKMKSASFTPAVNWSGGCICCEYYHEQFADSGACYCGRMCLVQWEGGSCMSGDSAYAEWCWAETVEERKRRALAVAELFERELDRL